MLKVCNVNIKDSQKVYKKLIRFVSKIKKRFPIKEVYLFGSFARGEIHEASDIDLIIVGEFKEKLFERIQKIISLTDLPIEPLIYTPQEFKKLKKRNLFIKKIISEAKIL